jgi:23S rRNA (cytidine1920-2'-O)/16S rRNA (cytidine1409-2'-O)-methyltransferase
VSAVDRLDQHLVHAGLARSRNVAQRLIRAGVVTVDGARIDKPSYAVAPGQQVSVADDDGHRWVGRGALKLEHALTAWGPPRTRARTSAPQGARTLRVPGRRCLDVGASTGGFTQVLLAHEASHVTALDVGHGQLVKELAEDPRVVDLPGTNIRDTGPAELGRFDLVVGDVSFISLTLILPAVAALLAPDGDVVLLVKPQFEVGRDRLGRDGVVTSPTEHARAVNRVVEAGALLGLHPHGMERSPVRGAHGNLEYLLWLAAYAPGMMTPNETTARVQELTQPPDPEDN